MLSHDPIMATVAKYETNCGCVDDSNHDFQVQQRSIVGSNETAHPSVRDKHENASQKKTKLDAWRIQ